MWSAKTPSTPDDPSRGFGNGIVEVLKTAGHSGADVARVLHGTTIATNLILERKGARAALITTAGFKYVIEIGRQDVPRSASLFAWVKPKRPVAPEHIHEVTGRIGPDGSELQALDEAAVRAAAQAIEAEGIGAVAVVLLHSYANPAHERRVAAILAKMIPDALVTISSDVLPVFREYERSMTTILNASVMPVVAAYVERLDARIIEQGIDAPLLLMKSSRGVTSVRTVRKAPVETASRPPYDATSRPRVAGCASFDARAARQGARRRRPQRPRPPRRRFLAALRRPAGGVAPDGAWAAYVQATWRLAGFDRRRRASRCGSASSRVPAGWPSPR